MAIISESKLNIFKKLILNKYSDTHIFKYMIRDNNVPTEWLEENLEGKYGKILFYYLFELESDAIMFKLTWEFT
jgi:hypothetical protein